MYYLGLYWEFIKIRLKTMVEYRSNTIWTGIAEACGYTADFLVIWIMISKFHNIGDWNAYEVIFLYAINLLTYSLSSMFLYRTCNNLSFQIRTGEFDDIITKPTNPFLYLCCSGFMYGYYSHISVSIFFICFCLAKLGVTLSISKIFFLILSLIGGALIQGAMNLFTTVPSFWMVKNTALRSLTWSGRNFIEYPISIYHKSIQIILTVILPFAFISFYPAQYFLGKSDFLMFHPIFQFLTPVVGVILFALAYMFWCFGIKHYNSSGS